MVRNQTQANIKKVLLIYRVTLNVLFAKNRIENRILMRMILAYSAINSKANPNLPYSILNPDTSSDSPSAKSKGVRFVSARQEMSQIIHMGANNVNFHHSLLRPIIANKFILALRVKKNIKISASLTSYDTVCAIDRRAPMSAYFLLDAHPEIRTG